jgi:hypothetical protein
MGGAALGVVSAGLIEAELSVDGEADIAGVIVFLAVVFPPANRAKAIGGRGLKGFKSTARTAIAMIHGFPYFGRRPTQPASLRLRKFSKHPVPPAFVRNGRLIPY